MKNAYALLGLSFVIVFAGVYFILERSEKWNTEIYEAPTVVDTMVTNNEIKNMSLTLTSPAFEDGGIIPSKYTCDGENISPEMHISHVPDDAGSLVLVMDDPDIPDEVKNRIGTQKFDHWVVYNIPVDTRVLEAGVSVGREGLNSRGEPGYVGSCPPDGEHRYFYRLYAVSGTLDFATTTPTLDEVEAAAKGSALESAVLMGRYTRINN